MCFHQRTPPIANLSLPPRGLAARFARNIGRASLLVLVGALLALAIDPSVRRLLVAELNDPAWLAALPADPRVRVEHGAESCAQEVAALLPAAVASVETEQGGPFARAPLVGVYATLEAYGRVVGAENTDILGVSLSGRLVLSPKLCGSAHERLAAVLTHELSHVHLFGHHAFYAARPPSWFTEGLAVMVSHGGGAEEVSETEGADAIRSGYAIDIAAARLWFGPHHISFEREPPIAVGRDAASFRQHIAYRQASMFVAFLRAQDPRAFKRLLDSLAGNEPFAAAFAASYGDIAVLWTRFKAAPIQR